MIMFDSIPSNKAFSHWYISQWRLHRGCWFRIRNEGWESIHSYFN